SSFVLQKVDRSIHSGERFRKFPHSPIAVRNVVQSNRNCRDGYARRLFPYFSDLLEVLQRFGVTTLFGAQNPNVSPSGSCGQELPPADMPIRNLAVARLGFRRIALAQGVPQGDERGGQARVFGMFTKDLNGGTQRDRGVVLQTNSVVTFSDPTQHVRRLDRVFKII